MIKWRCKECGKKNARSDGVWRCVVCGEKVTEKGLGAPMLIFRPGFLEHYETIDEDDQLNAELPARPR